MLDPGRWDIQVHDRPRREAKAHKLMHSSTFALGLA